MTLDVWIGAGLGLTYLILVVWGLQVAARRRRVLGTLAGQLSKLRTLLPSGPLEELSGAPSAMVVLQDEAEQKRHAGEEAEVAGLELPPVAPSQELVAGQVTLQVLGCRCPRCGLTWDVTILEREKVCYCGQAFRIPSVRSVEGAIGQVLLGTGVLYRCPRCQTAGPPTGSFRCICGQAYRCGADAS